MRSLKSFLGIAVILFIAAPTICLAQNAAMERHYGDGEAGNALGTTIYNHYHPQNPLPESKGDVLQDTARNLGAGQNPRNAFMNASKSNAGLDKAPSNPGSKANVAH